MCTAGPLNPNSITDRGIMECHCCYYVTLRCVIKTLSLLSLLRPVFARWLSAGCRMVAVRSTGSNANPLTTLSMHALSTLYSWLGFRFRCFFLNSFLEKFGTQIKKIKNSIEKTLKKKGTIYVQ